MKNLLRWPVSMVQPEVCLRRARKTRQFDGRPGNPPRRSAAPLPLDSLSLRHGRAVRPHKSRSRSRGRWCVLGAMLLVLAGQPGGAGWAQEAGDVRLASGSTALEGRVEVYHNGQWGTVCDDGWNNADAAVVCRQVGYGGGTAKLRATFRPHGSGPIWMDNVHCSGTESQLTDCPFNGFGIHDCDHTEDAGVVCTQPPAPAIATPARPIVTSDPATSRSLTVNWEALPSTAGITGYQVQIKWATGGNWTPASPPTQISLRKTFGNLQPNRAHVARVRAVNSEGVPGPWSPEGTGTTGTLTTLPAPGTTGSIPAQAVDVGATAAVDVSTYFTGSGLSYAATAIIPGTASVAIAGTAITVCGEAAGSATITVTARTGGGSAEQEFVVTVNDPPVGTPVEKCTGAGAAIRLVGGRAASEGRVEVYHNGQWGTVCDDLWNAPDAAVVCRQLGHSGGAARQGPTFGYGSGPIWLDNVECTGTEGQLIDCPYDSITNDCSHREDAGVVCTAYSPPIVSALPVPARPTVTADPAVPGSLAVSWTAVSTPPAITGYQVQIKSVTAGGHWTPIYPPTQTALSTTFADLQYGQRYLVRVRTVNSAGVSAWSSEVPGTPPLVGITGSIPAQEIDVGGTAAVEVSTYFAGNGLRYAATSSASGTASVEVRDSAVTVCGEAAGSATITVTARTGGGSAEQQFVVTVSDPPMGTPVQKCTGAGAAIRLVGGRTASEGRVEVYHDGRWGTVCDDLWDDTDAAVVCRQLGYSGGEAREEAAFGAGSGPIWLDDVRCSGTEAQLADCPSRGFGSHNCVHIEDAGVVCTAPPSPALSVPAQPTVTADPDDPTRLTVSWTAVSTPPAITGYQVQIKWATGGTWAPASPPTQTALSKTFGNLQPNRAHVARVRTVNSAGEFGNWSLEGTGSTSALPPPGVTGSIPALAVDVGASTDVDVSTYFTGNGRSYAATSSAPGTASAAVAGTALTVCGEAAGSATITVTARTAGGSAQQQFAVTVSDPPMGPVIPKCTAVMRLVGGNTILEGRVEVYHNGQWGTVCDDLWTAEDAAVACRQLGHSGGTPRIEAAFGAGSGPIWLDNVECTGTEGQLIDCPYDPITSDCTHREDVGVECTATSPPIVPTLPVPARPTVTSDPANLTHLTVSWAAPSSTATITGYQVQIKWATGGRWTPIYPPTQTALSTTFEDLQPNRAHVARVRAVNSAGVSSWSPEGTGTTGAPPTPAQPTVTADPDEQTRLTVSWTAPSSTSGITGYQVQIKWATGGNWTPASPPTQTTLSTTFGNLQPNRAHVARVRAVNSAGVPGPWSPEGTGTTSALPPPGVTGSIPALALDAGTSTDVDVSTYFTGNGLRYAAASSAPGTASVEVRDSAVTVCGEAAGSATITVTARNTGGSAQQQFAVTVSDPPMGMVIPKCAAGIRLVGGNTILEGRVEVYHNGQWGTVCDDLWDNTDAAVACRQLGHSGGAARQGPTFGYGSGPIWLDNLECTGTESQLIECPYDSITSDCSHREDAGVVCTAYSPPIVSTLPIPARPTVTADPADRMSLTVSWTAPSSTATITGYQVQIKWATGGRWTPIYPATQTTLSTIFEDLQPNRAHVARVRTVNSAGVSAWSPEGSGRTPLVGVTGSIPAQAVVVGATAAVDVSTYFTGRGLRYAATSSAPGTASVEVRDSAVTVCGEAAGSATITVTARTGGGSAEQQIAVTVSDPPMGTPVEKCTGAGAAIRLVGGRTASEGRVEVYHDGRWGTVCDDLWNAPDAAVVCRQLGYSGGEAREEAAFGAGSGPIWLDDVRCSGTEAQLADCPSRGFGSHNCVHIEDAGVVCTPPSSSGDDGGTDQTNVDEDGVVGDTGGNTDEANVEPVNRAPAFAANAITTLAVAENSPAGTNIGAPFTATDPDNDSLTYSLSGTDAASFRINATGQLQTFAALDYETKDSYSVIVSVHDGVPDTTVDATLAVTINVTDVDETPSFAANAITTLTVAENSPAGTNIGAPFTATDPDNDSLTYSLSGTDAASFRINATGQLQTFAALDYETKDSYSVTVSVHDGVPDTTVDATLAVTINVTDVDETPLRLEGTAGDDTLEGGAGDDELIGRQGDDTLRGHGGQDLLKGGRGDDNLNGGAGDDELRGWHGDDHYTGGPGADDFVLSPWETGSKLILDFESGVDALVLAAGSDWPAVATVLATEQAGDSGGYLYTLRDDLTVETQVALTATDIVVE